MKVAVVGAGYVGAVTAAGLAAFGHDVIVQDKDTTRARRLAAADPDIYEPGLAELARKAGSRLRAADRLAAALDEARVALVCVDTPASEDGSIDLTRVQAACREIAGAAREPLVVAIRSTVIPGTTDRVDREIFQASGRRVEAAANPEFLREGQAVADFVNPDRMIVGVRSASAREALRELYAFSSAPLLWMSPSSAELAKYASNALLAALISFSNELADIAEAVEGADVVDALRAVHADRRWRTARGAWEPEILSYLWPGCGYGGSCLPKDLKAILAAGREHGVALPLLAAVDAANERRAQHIVDLIESVLGVYGREVSLLGTAFKEGTADQRSSPALALARALVRKGARVIAYDPLVAGGELPDGCVAASSLDEALRTARVWIVVTHAPDFAGLPQRAKADGALLVDARRRFEWIDGARFLGPGRAPRRE